MTNSSSAPALKASDLSKAYWIVAGIGGGDPADVSLGSAVWADRVIDGELGFEIDGREIPPDWPTGFVPLRKAIPYEKPVRTDLEGEIYALLESKGVPNIPPFGKGNDVRDHTTLTHTLRDEKWACWSRAMVLLRQYRMSLDVIARHLTWFNSSREFVGAIADAMEGKTFL